MTVIYPDPAMPITTKKPMKSKRPPMGPILRKPNPLWGKSGLPRMTFADLGATDWGALIGTAASVYTGQPNALSQPKPAPVVTYGPPSPPPVQPQILTPVKPPFYKNPWVIGGATLVVAGLGYMLVRGRRSRR